MSVPPADRGSMVKTPPKAPALTRMLSSPLDGRPAVRPIADAVVGDRESETATVDADVDAHGRGLGVAGDVGQRFAQAQQQVAACRFDDDAVDRTLDVATRCEPERGGRVVADRRRCRRAG